MSLFADSTASISPFLPVLVFVAEMCVVTLSTIRIIFVSRGMKGLASILGFFEICIWLFAIGQIMQNLSHIGCYLAFAAGFTIGNYLGILIERRLGIGTLVVEVISNRDTADLIQRLKLAGFGVTCINGEGAMGPVKIVYTVIKRKELPNVVSRIQAFDPKAFYSVHDIHEAAEGIFPESNRRIPTGVISQLLGLGLAVRRWLPQPMHPAQNAVTRNAA